MVNHGSMYIRPYPRCWWRRGPAPAVPCSSAATHELPALGRCALAVHLDCLQADGADICLIMGVLHTEGLPAVARAPIELRRDRAEVRGQRLELHAVEPRVAVHVEVTGQANRWLLRGGLTSKGHGRRGDSSSLHGRRIFGR